MNIAEMSLQQLNDLYIDVRKQIDQRTQDDILHAKERILAIALSVGLSVKDIVGAPTTKKVKNKVPIQYQHPDNATLQWTGRGRKPKWVVAWIESGKTMDQTKIKV